MATQKGRNWSSGDIVTAANLQSIERGVSAVVEEYTPTTWANGDTVTAAALNNIEQGIANAEGGGSSDFSTAQVTFINSAGHDIFNTIICMQFEDGDFTEKYTAFVLDYEVGINTYPEIGNINEGVTTSLSFYLLNGCNFGISFGNANDISVSGLAEKITYDRALAVIITGDCTITISDSSDE